MANNLPPIPLAYRILLLWFEPLAAFNGALLCLFSPSTFLRTFTVLPYVAASQVIYDQLAACYVLFAWNEAIVLRYSQDLRVWKAIVLGILVCDMVHLYASWHALSTEVFLRPWLWRAEEWVNHALLYGPGAMRVAFLMEVGFGKEKKKRN
ncbi:hypothetical protein EV356DRAFT_443330 [Viridothelium virens]|uniref:DUF7704 domain-containing protein n=1 Tax=Viridothelium virens TaxID=1048519 RepID=A0A6A6HEL5_VIRVR|nr:hypothetical protein EV356DRAFT_443330 [Viridothelium virens]